MASKMTRREMVAGSAVAVGAAALGLPDWAMASLPQDEALVPFADMPGEFVTNPSPIVRFVDIRTIEDFFTPAGEFFTIQHYGQPDVDASGYRLKLSGLVARPLELSLAEIRRRPRSELACAFECSGNSGRRFHGLVSNGLWSGTSLRALLEEAGAQPAGREVVFFGADRGTETITSRGNSWEVEQQFARSLSLDDAMGEDTMLAWELNGEPLTVNQGAPLRLIVPGWYGVAQVKWLEQIHVQEDRFMGKFMAREYVTLRSEEVGGELKHTETSITRMKLKSVIARVTRGAGHYTIRGFALGDGTPLSRVEVRIDDGPWRPAELDPRNTRYSWQLFSYRWEGAAPGEHTIVSRAIDASGAIQPVAANLETKLTTWENNAQFPRRIVIS